MRRAQRLMTTEDLFLYLLGRGLAEQKRLAASVGRAGSNSSVPGHSGSLEASLYVIYESPIFPKDPLGSAEIMAITVDDVPRGRLLRLLDEALWEARGALGNDGARADLSPEVMALAEMNAFKLLIELPSVCLRQNEAVLDAARKAGLVDFDIPAMTPKERSTLPCNATGLTPQVVELLAERVPERDTHWELGAGSTPGMA